MNKLDDVMAKLAAKKRKALIAYLCMGDPSLDESVELAVACAEAGADILELGVPFSDPTADGPVIARAAERALHAGGGLAPSIQAAARIRARNPVSLLLFGYYNPIFVHGEERTVREAREAGIDGLLVVDLPVEEARSLRGLCQHHDIALIPLVSPTSPQARVALTREALSQSNARGFVYYVSVAGVTGSLHAEHSQSEPTVDPLAAASMRAAELREAIGAPVVIGFGIDSEAKAKVAAQHADGVVVGSAIVRHIAEAGDAATRKHEVEALIAALAAAINPSG